MIIILFGEINVPGQSIIQPVTSDVNGPPKINCRLGKGLQPLLACLRALENPHQSLSGKKKATGVPLQLGWGGWGETHLSGTPNGPRHRCSCAGLHAIHRERGLVEYCNYDIGGLWYLAPFDGLT